MPFGLWNALHTFMRLMHEILKSYMDKFYVVFFDEILIFSKDLNEYFMHLRVILQALRANILYLNIQKCVFINSSIHFLGYIISIDELKVDPSKVEAIQNWPQPKSSKDIHNFHGIILEC